MICLIGPGGAGKSTVGPILASQLGRPFRDLDQHCAAIHGNIDDFVTTQGYEAYARANVEVYQASGWPGTDCVLALSSGFMTYPPEVHHQYPGIRRHIEKNPTTFLLLPSFDLEACVAETVRRQLQRPIGGRGAAQEEAVIRRRFALYWAIPVDRVATMRPAAAVAADIQSRLKAIPSGRLADPQPATPRRPPNPNLERTGAGAPVDKSRPRPNVVGGRRGRSHLSGARR